MNSFTIIPSANTLESSVSPLAVPSSPCQLAICTLAVELFCPHHRVGGVEDVEEALADGLGQDVVLGA